MGHYYFRYCRSFNLSFIVFFIFDLLWSNHGFNFRELFLGYAFVCLFALCISVFLWPDSTFKFEEQRLAEIRPDQENPRHKVGLLRAPSTFKHATLNKSAGSNGTSAPFSSNTSGENSGKSLTHSDSYRRPNSFHSEYHINFKIRPEPLHVQLFTSHPNPDIRILCYLSIVQPF